MSSAESIPFSAWWPSPCRAGLTDWLNPTELFSALGTHTCIYTVDSSYRLKSHHGAQNDLKRPSVPFLSFWMILREHWHLIFVVVTQLLHHTLFDCPSALAKTVAVRQLSQTSLILFKVDHRTAQSFHHYTALFCNTWKESKSKVKGIAEHIVSYVL